MDDALSAVNHLEHRGAVSRDGRTSDGAGLQTQIPWGVIAPTLSETDQCAVGMLFLDPAQVPAQRELFEAAVAESGLDVVLWREVPFDANALGPDAVSGRPEPWQLVVRRGAGQSDLAFDQAGFAARRNAMQAARDAGFTSVSVPSWSRRTIVYKGLVLPRLLPELYPDLSDPGFESAIALFHQRYSTNTQPSWRLAQPLRYLAHNGEINTLLANVSRMAARQSELSAAYPWLGSQPIIEAGGSDSAALDNALELLALMGCDTPEAMAILVPEAHEARPQDDHARRDFARYYSALMEPWDGPASLVFSDGVIAGAALDRNGLRPLRYWITEDERVIVGSEAGIVDVGATAVIEKGRLGPGELLVVDTARGRVVRNHEVKAELAARQDWTAWAGANLSLVGSIDEVDVPDLDDESLITTQQLFGYGREHLDRILSPMALAGAIPIGSMGDDTPLAVLSERPQRLYMFFMQRFAQVTNPSIDPLRERNMMSLTTRVSVAGTLADTEPRAKLVEFESPIISAGHIAWLRENLECLTLSATFEAKVGLAGLEQAIEQLCDAATAAVAAGTRVLILSDRIEDDSRAPIPMLLATGAIRHHLIRQGQGGELTIVCDAGDVIEDHDIACLIGFGASLVHPWLGYESAAAIARRSTDAEISEAEAVQNYRKALAKGLLKIMAKLGIADVNSYRGAQAFEALGVDAATVDRHFTGCPSRIGGINLRDIAECAIAFHADAHGSDHILHELGIFRFRRGGEYHAFHPGVFKWLHKAVRENDQDAFKKYTDAVDTRPPTTMRDLLQFRPAGPAIPLDEVESSEGLALRFCTQAMSFGSLSREAHEVLAVAMNRIGGKSNSGEGGEEPERLKPYTADAPERSVAKWHPGAGDSGTSAIKQIASGRFGVTPDYLVSAQQLEIKMAQGSKPGEGGQIPGFKVTEEIARTRRSQAGTTLISPPPHHDIYSIEDLAQLIYDLKRINKEATVAVKLVSVVGVGTIATGVAKGYADALQISGHDGGTGASPLGSIKHAGLPWELGLGEVQQRLVANDLRGRVTLRVDGGLKTGRDVVVAALLGAEEFGFGTAALVAAGCVMARQCHANTCPVGVATQREDLRARFPGKPEHVIAFMMFIAEHVRLILAELGVRSLDEIIGRVEMLEQRSDLPERARRVDISKLLWAPTTDVARRREVPRNDRPEPKPLDEEVLEACAGDWQPLERTWTIVNADRSVGARLSGEIARRGRRLKARFFDLRFVGVSGQSFGAFCNDGMRLTLAGEAQDYVGKGMAGGEVVLFPASWDLAHAGSVIMGNTCAYGATGGSLFAAGAAGERLAVRNSGAEVVVEGCGDHGCEYMTAGTVVVLGPTGYNFAAGMTGGRAFVWDRERALPERLNEASVEFGPVGDDLADLHEVIARYRAATLSPLATRILADWETESRYFVAVLPIGSTPAQTRRSA